MRPLLSFGEVLIDLLQDPSEPGRFIRHAGGAPANVAVGFARLGGTARFVGARADDGFGRFLHEELAGAGVDVTHLQVTREAPTALAVVSLDGAGERSFSFYRPPAADLLFDAARLDEAAWDGPPIFHWCSNTLTHPGIRAQTDLMLERARRHGATLSLDMNLRPSLWPRGEVAADSLLPLLPSAEVLKASREEWDWLASRLLDPVAHCLGGATRLILITDGPRPMRVIDRQGEWLQEVAALPMVDSTAAGDAFMSGLLACLARQPAGTAPRSGASPGALDDRRWQAEALAFASRCGGLACGRYGAFASLPTLAEVGVPWPAAAT